MQKEYRSKAPSSKKPIALKDCLECKKPFTPKYPEQRYCSRPCYTNYLKANAKGYRFEELFQTKRSKAALAAQPKLKDPFEEFDDDLWAERAKYWEEQDHKQKPKRKLYGRGASRERHPLVLTGHGIRLKLERGTLLIQNGYTYYPQKRQEWRLFPGDWRLPSRIYIIESSGSLSIHVINWLNQQRIPLIVLNWQGEIVSVIGEAQTTFDPNLVKAQKEALTNGKGLEISIELIREKISQCQETLKSLPKEFSWGRAVHKLDLIKTSLEHRATDYNQLRLIEALAAQTYFAVWQKLKLNWKESKKHPIPDDWRYYTQRESLVGYQNRYAT